MIEPHAGERPLAHVKRQSVIGDGGIERPLGVDQKLITKIKVFAHLSIEVCPGKLRVTPTVIGIYIGLAVATGDRNRVPIGVPLPLVTLLDWLRRVGALLFDCGQHVSSPAHVAYIFVLLE